ncbi:hypothetical protein [Dactylosporangium sp. NPDC050588]|uniref:hypothetical protein n=1 Tax=Dactylosporangium sp. NPDC050588 TaxID=3157211 RepID=UPI0033F943C1
MQPVVAIVGSADASRSYEPEVRNREAVSQAARAIGRELAAAGCRIAVFSSDPGYIEGAVVAGYVESGSAGKHSILVRGRFGSDGAFPERNAHPQVFLAAPDPTGDWEVAFCRTLLEVDAVLLVGGGRSTFTAGLIALSRGIAVAPVATFGGAAERVWRRLAATGVAAEEDIAVLAAGPAEHRAAEVVAVLLGQHRQNRGRAAALEHDRRAASRRTAVGLTAAMALLVLTLLTIPVAYAVPAGTWQNVAVLVAAPLLASTWGAVVRNVYDGAMQWLRAAALGSAAGTVAFLLFIAAQLATNPSLFTAPGTRSLTFFVLAVGFIGGFTSESVYRKLRDRDVVNTSALPPAGP